MLAIIPCKSQSERAPGKNRRCIGGVPLWRRAVRFAENIGTHPIITTDDQNTIEDCRVLGITCLVRPAHLCLPETPMSDVMMQVLDGADEESFLLLQPTSPFRSADMFHRLVDLYSPETTVCTGTRTNPMTFVGGKPQFQTVQNSQNWPMAFDGNMLITGVARFMREQRIYAQRTEILESSPPYCLQIDTEEEFEFLRRISAVLG